jgi:hypothetical protein
VIALGSWVIYLRVNYRGYITPNEMLRLYKMQVYRVASMEYFNVLTVNYLKILTKSESNPQEIHKGWKIFEVVSYYVHTMFSVLGILKHIHIGH